MTTFFPCLPFRTRSRAAPRLAEQHQRKCASRYVTGRSGWQRHNAGVQIAGNSARSGFLEVWAGGSMTASRMLVTLTLLAAMGTVVACGRKAGLDTPYEAAVQA